MDAREKRDLPVLHALLAQHPDGRERRVRERDRVDDRAHTTYALTASFSASAEAITFCARCAGTSS